MPENDLVTASSISDMVTGLPAPLKTSFLKAMSDLLGGLVSIPAAKLRQYAQGIEDTTQGRSEAAGVLAKAAAGAAAVDPIMAQAAAEVYLPTIVRKTRNRIAVAQSASEHIQEKCEQSDQALPPDDDWMNTFMRFAEDASSPRLQDLFGRILSGEISRPGAFALSTLRAVSELNQEIATDFSEVWEKSVGNAVHYSSELNRGVGFTRWKRLAEAGLMAPEQIAQYLPPFESRVNGNGLWTPAYAEGVSLLVHFPAHCSANWRHIMFTRAGQEIGTLLPKPDYARNLREVGESLATQGVARVELLVPGQPVEVIFGGKP